MTKSLLEQWKLGRPGHRKWIFLVVLAIAGFLSLHLSARVSTSLAAGNSPVWGTKPVLGYLLTTAGLPEKLRSDLGLSPEQFETIQQLGLKEWEAIRTLDVESRSVLADKSLTFEEKREWVSASGYNRRVSDAIQDTDRELQNNLDTETYEELIDWVEQQWVIEKNTHASYPLGAEATTGEPRTFKVYATRHAVDEYTVHMPDQCLKHANNGYHICDDDGYAVGQDYSVKVKYTGGSVTVKVTDVGAWNIDDNYWSTTSDPQPRRMFTDLPLGIPEAQAAYFDGYNGGLDQFGREVTSPVGIELGRQVSIDIGLEPGTPAVNSWIDVTFLWTDDWDSTPPPAEETILLEQPSSLEPAYSGDMCGSAWHKITGYNGQPAYLTLNVDDADLSTNSGKWQPNLPASGEYKVEAFVPDHAPVQWECPSLSIGCDTEQARYTIHHADGKSSVTHNQCPLANEWLDLGTYEFDAGQDGYVELSDLNGEASLSHTVSFSAVRFKLVSSSNPSTPTPTAIPTPTPTPTPRAYVTSPYGQVASGGEVTAPVFARMVPAPGIGRATVEVYYDPRVMEAVSCTADPQGLFSGGTCDISYDDDRNIPDIVRIELESAAGVIGESHLAEIEFRAVGQENDFSVLGVYPASMSFFGDSAASMIANGVNGGICIQPCNKIFFLPFLP